ncbi:MAG: cytochrome c, partial [Acidimicrobiia bacterium]|nr:cytochrome c [Acidimicrobiia bacterium]
YDLFAQRCATCHVVDGSYDEVAADSPSAPNLTHLFSRDCFAGCMFEQNRNELEAWLRNPQRKAGSLMVIAELSEAEIDQLYAYLETLE